MSPLTGESEPIPRSAARSRPAPTPLESDDLVFAGTLCTAGDALAVVYATGMATQLGRIAALSQRVKTEASPLQVQVNHAAWLIAAVAVGAGVAFLAVGTLLAGLPLDDAVTFAIGLLVANVPEGLLPTITLALAVGVRRMARRRALVKRLTAVETLGSTDIICTDKTGTLTEGRMAVQAFWADGRELRPTAAGRAQAAAEPFSALLRTAVRCNNASARRDGDGWERGGDPSESALLIAAATLGEDVDAVLRGRGTVRRRVFHFDPRLKRMTTVDREGADKQWLHSKAPRSSCSSAARSSARPRATGRWTPRGGARSQPRSRTMRAAACVCSPSPSGGPRPRRPRTATMPRSASPSSVSPRCRTRRGPMSPTPCARVGARASASLSSPATTG